MTTANSLSARGHAVVGSREASEADLEYATGLGRLAAAQGRAIVSGARGVDEAAMLGTLNKRRNGDRCPGRQSVADGAECTLPGRIEIAKCSAGVAVLP